MIMKALNNWSLRFRRFFAVKTIQKIQDWNKQNDYKDIFID